ncbi:MAG: tRNA (guanosine(37)-N1)-methyltransferase TrmD [Myxococcales bacterium]|nr:tRNA (guanosine(37)-N1)-methyltransferase TrmD [Myxococcales bacterium]
MKLRVTIVTLFPELFSALEVGLLGKAMERGQLEVDFVNPRDFTTDKHRTVDDAPYGGGSGMVLMPGPYVDALEKADPDRTRHRVMLTPQGKRFAQADAQRLAERGDLVLVCGRYEGFDERIREEVDEEISLGDFVLLGGEVAALAVVEATARLVPGVLGNEQSPEEESHARGLLEYPQYTRPWVFRGREVPEILRSGHHEQIARWRLEQSLRRTLERRPDLLENREFSPAERKILEAIQKERREDSGGEAGEGGPNR